MKRKQPLIPEDDENINKVIWEELRMITMFLAEIKINQEKNIKSILDIENRMISKYDFENGINKICTILNQIAENKK